MASIETVQVEGEGLTLDVVKKRSVLGIVALTSRNFILQSVNFVSLIFFTALFSQAEYGVYGIVLAIRGFLSYFSDIGLAAALIQKKEKVTLEELKTTFLIQQILVVSLVMVGFAATPFLSSWQRITGPGVYLLWSFYIAFFLSSLKTIPSVLLERKLDFTRLIIPQILESVVFNSLAIILALQGFGILSLAYAVLAQSIVGVVSMYVLQPWKPGFSFSFNALKGLFKFGVPYQLNTFLAVIKDDGLVIVLGGILGPAGLGFLLWAKKWGEAPLRFFMDQVIKVTFPAFSRLQGNKEELSSALSRSIFFVCLFVFPSIVGLVLLSPMLTQIVERYRQWQPALLALSLFGVNAAIAAVTTPLTNMLNAIGKIKTTFKLMLMWVMLTWIFVPVLAQRGGFTGAATGALIVGLSSFIAIFIAYRTVKFDLVYSVGKPLLASFVLGLTIVVLKLFIPANFTSVALLVICGMVSYLASVYILVGPSIVEDSRKVFAAVFRRKNFFSAFLAIFLFLLTFKVAHASPENQFITLVNPVRISRYTVDSAESIRAQYKIVKANKLSTTWLLTFDVLNNPKAISVVKSMDLQQEKGIFLEVTPQFAQKAGVVYNNSGFWHFATSVFLSGYIPPDRIKLIDAVFEKFRSNFGYYPTSVGGWWVDAYSLSYIKKKYNITAHLGLADQLSTDGYEVWGGYWSTPFYPSKNHTGIPAGTLDSKLDIVELEWAPRDPLNGYKDSKYSTQDYPLMGQDFSYFEKLVRLFAGQHDNQFGQITLGLEGDFPAESYTAGSEFAKQMEFIRKLADQGDYAVANMKEFSAWYRKKFTGLSPVHVVKTNDLMGTDNKLIWYNSPNYRVGIRYDAFSQKTEIVDLRIYQTGFQEPYFSLPNTDKDLTIYIPAVIDQSTDLKSVWDLNVGQLQGINQDKDNLVLTFSSGKNITLTPSQIIAPASVNVPSFVKAGKLLAVNKDREITLTPNSTTIAPREGVQVAGLTLEAWHFLRQRKIKLLLGLGGAAFVLLIFLATKTSRLRPLLFASLIISIGAVGLFANRWYQKNVVTYWVSQNEIYALARLALLPPGKVLVYDHECLQCVFVSNKPAAFANARNYVQRWSKHPIAYNSTVFEAKDLKVGKKEFFKQNVSYVYLVKYPYYEEKLPFSPGDFNVEKIYDDANAEIWRVKNEK